MKMDPLNNLQVCICLHLIGRESLLRNRRHKLITYILPYQVAMKNNIDVFYFACLVPMHALFTEDGEMEKRVFLATWKDIPAQNEIQFTLQNVEHSGGK